MATLTIKNESGAKLELATPGGVVKLDAGQSGDLTDKQLKSSAVADAVRSGKVSFTVDKPDEGQKALAKTVLPAMVSGTGAKLTQLKTRFDQSQQELFKLREAFNKTRKVVESNLDAAQSSMSGWAGLRKAVRSLILEGEGENDAVREKKDALQAAEKALEDLKAEDLGATHRSLEDWYKDRLAKDTAVKEAREALAKVSREKANPLEVEIATLDVGIAAVQGIAKNKAIGKEIPEFGQ